MTSEFQFCQQEKYMDLLLVTVVRCNQGMLSCGILLSSLGDPGGVPDGTPPREGKGDGDGGKRQGGRVAAG